MRKPITLYGLTFSLPMLLWQVTFFLAPLLFLIALSFWTVRNFRMEPDFDTVNWVRILGRGVFWDAYLRTFTLSAACAAVASALAFPVAYAIAFKLSDTARRWAIFLMVIPFFTSYLVRVYSWQIFLSDNGIFNALFARVGLGPFTMLNTSFGVMIGYLTLCLPLVVLLQLFSLIFIDRNLIEAAHNLGCGRLRTVFEVVVPSARVGMVIAALFVGPIRDPVRNVWVLQWAALACAGVIPLALIAGPIRGIPFFWQLVDCSFGLVGIVPIWICLRMVRRLEAISSGGVSHPTEGG